ncbi:MAG: hypothetical protein B6U72_03395 [Candidatus Altiarchaeales archaeon ex4484_2]|nr:MAG: hypothetical protein B6U72_03395 [Candidatus Altiarchaeales archaeon ex4484_2]
MASSKDRVAIRLDVIADIIKHLDEDEELQEIFGRPVSKSLIIVADNNDLRIEEGGGKELSEKESEKFLEVLNKAVKRYTT